MSNTLISMRPAKNANLDTVPVEELFREVNSLGKAWGIFVSSFIPVGRLSSLTRTPASNMVAPRVNPVCPKINILFPD